MSRPSHRERETAKQHCKVTGKAIYDTEIEARMALAEVQARRRYERQKTVEKSVYRCGQCGRWHLTRQLSAI